MQLATVAAPIHSLSSRETVLDEKMATVFGMWLFNIAKVREATDSQTTASASQRQADASGNGVECAAVALRQRTRQA